MSDTTNFNPSNGLNGKRVLIVGGTSGIGLAAAIEAKGAGARVTVLGSEQERSRTVATEHGFEGWRAADVTSPHAIQKALSDIGHVDHLVLLAGTFVAGKVLEADVTYLRRAFEERIWAAVHILRTLGDNLSADASITFISGALADRPNAYPGGARVLVAKELSKFGHAHARPNGNRCKGVPEDMGMVRPGARNPRPL